MAEPVSLAPIALFVYRRPAHARQALESLAANPLAARSELTIYADGAKGGDAREREDVEAVRRLLRERDWCGKVRIVESPVNRGLAAAITGGVSEVLRRHGRAIVLEDDLVLAPAFLDYMNDALQAYAAEERVMHVAGYSPPVAATLPATYLYRNTTCWGWGTWARAWQHYNPDAAQLFAELARRKLFHRFNLDGSYPAVDQLIDNIDGTRETWAIKWYASVMLAGGLCLHPHPSLVQNIGTDDSGTHTGASEHYRIASLAGRVPVAPLPAIEESQAAADAIRRFNLAAHPGITGALRARLRALAWRHFPSTMARRPR
jgi:hypothetical protein